MADKPLWTWDGKRYHDSATGRYIGIDKMNSLREDFFNQQKEIVAGYAERYRVGSMSLEQLESAMRLQIKNAYIDMYALGAGGRGNMTQSDWGRIGAMLKEQYGQNGYLRGFMESIASGNLSEAQIVARMNMYINSANQALWKGHAKDLPIDLPAYPGDGSTVCLTNCRCTWDLRPVADGIDAYWQLGKSEHCPDCVERSQKWSPYKIRVQGGE